MVIRTPIDRSPSQSTTITLAEVQDGATPDSRQFVNDAMSMLTAKEIETIRRMVGYFHSLEYARAESLSFARMLAPPGRSPRVHDEDGP
ncbi:hypothetical protein [Amycolatopsis pittospori]|uniref:hypothetical protein n=1 Tax=Amycolatopsis pittospori TaxID=2749434 RepID=UPI0015F02114|nr:hypothetical protein [Amycolatopsis pittospori]